MQDGTAVLRVRQLQGRARSGAEEAPKGGLPQLHHCFPVSLQCHLQCKSKTVFSSQYFQSLISPGGWNVLNLSQIQLKEQMSMIFCFVLFFFFLISWVFSLLSSPCASSSTGTCMTTSTSSTMWKTAVKTPYFSLVKHRMNTYKHDVLLMRNRNGNYIDFLSICNGNRTIS